VVHLQLAQEFEGFEQWRSPATSGREQMRKSQKEQLESGVSLEKKDRNVATFLHSWFLGEVIQSMPGGK